MYRLENIWDVNSYSANYQRKISQFGELGALITLHRKYLPHQDSLPHQVSELSRTICKTGHQDSQDSPKGLSGDIPAYPYQATVYGASMLCNSRLRLLVIRVVDHFIPVVLFTTVVLVEGFTVWCQKFGTDITQLSPPNEV
ncbi:hypothetical protein BDZ91DRAFT_786049 [Kalaharituber pfeilii]|nr:hypothetical protein BDZ91DRAFT_786049 [Kalaharituber pfeilii]